MSLPGWPASLVAYTQVLSTPTGNSGVTWAAAEPLALAAGLVLAAAVLLAFAAGLDVPAALVELLQPVSASAALTSSAAAPAARRAVMSYPVMSCPCR
jgi:hypothetical protein